MAKSKKDARVVVNKAYFELLQKKAGLLDEGFDYVLTRDGFFVSRDMIKEYEKIDKAWQKLEWPAEAAEPYVEPKRKK